MTLISRRIAQFRYPDIEDAPFYVEVELARPGAWPIPVTIEQLEALIKEMNIEQRQAVISAATL